MDLYQKLLRLKQEGAGPSRDAPRTHPVAEPKRERFTLPGETRLGRHRLDAIRELNLEHLFTACGQAYPGGLQPQDVAFFDTETTGLGGAGSLVFLTGVLCLEDEQPVLHQFFLPQPAAEAAWLEQQSAFFARFHLLVSFNGKAFDSHAMGTRCVLNGLPHFLPELHLDLLHPARFFYREQSSECSLQALERNILQAPRAADDIPGALIPDCYFRYLHSGNDAEIERVLEHNRFDLLSLAVLALELAQLVAAGPTVSHDPTLLNLARRHVATGKKQQAEPLLDTLLARSRGDIRRRAAMIAKRLWLQQGDHERLLALLLRMLEEEGPHPWTTVEAAKLLEHRRRDYRAAERMLLRLTERGDNPANPTADDALLHRLLRIRRKLRHQPTDQNCSPGPGTDRVVSDRPCG